MSRQNLSLRPLTLYCVPGMFQLPTESFFVLTSSCYTKSSAYTGKKSRTRTQSPQHALENLFVQKAVYKSTRDLASLIHVNYNDENRHLKCAAGDLHLWRPSGMQPCRERRTDYSRVSATSQPPCDKPPLKGISPATEKCSWHKETRRGTWAITTVALLYTWAYACQTPMQNSLLMHWSIIKQLRGTM